MGMAIYDETQAIVQVLALNAASGTTPVAVMTETIVRGRLDHIVFSSNSASSQNVQVYVRYNAANYLLGQATIPANAGSAGVPAVDAVPLMWDGCDGLMLSSANTYRVAVSPALTGGDVLNVVTLGGVF